MAETQLYMAPMGRKKRVFESYRPNSYRVISADAERLPFIRPEVKSGSFDMPLINLIGQPASASEPSSLHLYRHYKPSASNVSFLQGNVRCMNNPVCHVQTTPYEKREHEWWPSRTSNEPLQAPPHVLDSVYRREYLPKKHVHGYTRHESNPNTVPAHGIAPVNALRSPSLKQRFWQEDISYEHQYDSRKNPAYPTRGKRHGAFVWSEMSPATSNKLLHAYGVLQDKVGQSSSIASNTEHALSADTSAS